MSPADGRAEIPARGDRRAWTAAAFTFVLVAAAGMLLCASVPAQPRTPPDAAPPAVPGPAPAPRGPEPGAPAPATASAVLPAPESLLHGIQFSEVAEAAGLHLVVTFGGGRKRYIVERPGTGLAFFDADGDTDMDLYLVNGLEFGQEDRPEAPSDALYRNDGDGTFTDITARSGIRDGRWGAGAAAADYDNDGDTDLYVTNFGPNALYRNNGDGTFTDVGESAGVDDPRWSSGAAWLDYDRDGDLDLYVANHVEFDRLNPPRMEKMCVWRGFEVGCGPLAYTPLPHLLYRNNGDGTFADVSAAAGISRTPGYGFGALAGDFDADGDPDVFVANDSMANFLWRNNGDGTFTDVALIAGAAYNEEGREQAGMGADFGDVNNDGRWDIFITTFSEDSNTLFRNDGGLFFSDVTWIAGLGEDSLPFLGWFTKFFDFDNDADQDLIVANGHVWPEADSFKGAKGYAQEPILYSNLGNGTYRNVSAGAGAVFAQRGNSRGGAVADYDNDGDLDVAIANIHQRPWLLRNDGGNRAAWIRFRLEGTRSNRDAIGARVSVRAGGRTQYYEIRSGDGYISSGDPRAHFGLGEAARAEAVEIRWPSGRTESLGLLNPGTEYTVREGRGVVGKRTLPLPAPRGEQKRPVKAQ